MVHTSYSGLVSNAAGLRIEELFRPHVNTVPIFVAVGADTKALYTQQQAAEVCDWRILPSSALAAILMARNAIASSSPP